MLKTLRKTILTAMTATLASLVVLAQGPQTVRGTVTDPTLYLTGSKGDADRYILPINPAICNGYGFNLDRDYLLPFQQRMTTLTNGLWEQNPGW